VTELLIYTCGILSTAIIVGLIWPHSALWKQVDLLYYPLGAFGVFLLFVSSTTQRQVAELSLQAEGTRVALEKVVATGGGPSSQLLYRSEASLFRIFVERLGRLDIDQYACRAQSGRAACVNGPKVVELGAAFWKANAKGERISEEAWQIQTCSYVAALLSDIRTKGALHRIVAEELSAYYQMAVAQEFKRATWKQAVEYMKLFPKWVDGKASKVRENGRPLVEWQLAIIRADATLGADILYALVPCIVGEWDGQRWHLEKQRLEKILRETDNQIKAIREAYREENPFLAFVRLWVWPYIINLALALKLAKAVAALRPPRLSKMPLTPIKRIPPVSVRARSFRNTPPPPKRMPKRKGGR
jgi:hypothetical protein